MCKISNRGYQIWAKQTPTQELKWKEKKTKTLIQALNFQNHQPKSRISLLNLFTQISKCKQRNSKIWVSNLLKQRQQHLLPQPTKRNKIKENKNENSIPTLLQHFTSNPSKILYPKKQNLKKISTKFQCKQNKIQNIGYKCYLGNHWWIPNKKEQNKTNKQIPNPNLVDPGDLKKDSSYLHVISLLLFC